MKLGIHKRYATMVIAAAMLLSASAAFAAEAPTTKADCLAIAAKYEKLAADQAVVTQEHKDMLDKYINSTFLPKQTRAESIAKMKKHCNAIIASSEKLAKEYTAMAEWHKTHAEMMEQ